LLANQLLYPRRSVSPRYRTGIMMERVRLIKKRRSFRYLGATSFCSFHGVVFTVMVVGRC
jgi:hypothetical protein